MKLFLIDAYSLIYRSYYAFLKNPRINTKGFNTSAIFGFVNTLEDILSREQPTHIGIAFDPAGKTFRHEAYAQYKDNRQETPEVIRASVPIIKDIVTAYRIPVLEVAGYEADDVIGTMARKAPDDWKVYMLTPDKDYVQLINDHVFMYNLRHKPKGVEIMGMKEVQKKYGIKNPEQMIDFLALTGDRTDNIPGCPGIGEKKALQLLTQYGSVKEILANVDKIQGAIGQVVKMYEEKILTSQFLVTIKTDVPVTFDTDALLVKDIDSEALKKIFDGLDFQTLAARKFGYPDMSRKRMDAQPSLFDAQPVQEAKVDTPDTVLPFKSVPHRYFAVRTPIETRSFAERLSAQKSVGFSIIANGADSHTAEPVGISFATEQGVALYMPLPLEGKDTALCIGLFREVLENPAITKVGYDLKFGLNILKRYGVNVGGPLFDTAIAHYLLKPERRYSLSDLVKAYLHYEMEDVDELNVDSRKLRTDVRQIPGKQLRNYVCAEADMSLRLKTVFENLIAKENLSELFYKVEMPLVKVLSDMEDAGVRLDDAVLKQSSGSLEKQMREIMEDVYMQVGEEFNINSPREVGIALFERLKLSGKAKKTGSGQQYSTNESVLEGLRAKHPVVDRILEYRRVKKLLSTYINALPELISPYDGKVHTTYNQTSTVTGRLSSTKPNLQNIPVRDDEGREIRRAFIPDEGCVFLSADYSQIELRIMAHLSEDPGMIEAFRSGLDIHAATAAKIYGLPVENVSRDMRRKAKTANFGIIYGISAYGLSKQLHVGRKEAKELIDGYFVTYPGVKEYIDRSIAAAHKNGYVETFFHRKRYLPDINSENAVVRGYAERNAVNAPVQGSAADIIKMAMNRIYGRFLDENLRSRMIMQVHDELNFNVLATEVERVRAIVVEEMENAARLCVPLTVDCRTGHNWMEAH
jgi:DNA polymerase-1